MTINTSYTRSGRKTKAPERMEPTESNVEDDFDDDEYDTDYDATEEDDLCETDSEDECVDSDEDEKGNLKGFIVSDNEDSDDEYEA